MISFNDYHQACTTRIEHFLERLLPKPTAVPTRLQEAMRYAVLNGGKRLRPLLVYATGEACGAELSTLDGAAAAIELIHSYSLVHDDLPAMDDDDLRRGKPSCHKAFGEALAILTGDALQALAFQLLSDAQLNPVNANLQIKMIRILAETSGAFGMVGGQAMDIEQEHTTEPSNASLERVCAVDQKKTGALITASILLGAIGAGCQDQKQLIALEQYGSFIGLAFQVQDDILDVTGNTATLGKTQGKDSTQNKATFPALMGLTAAYQYAQELHEKALLSIKFLASRGQHLASLSEFCIKRIS